MKQLILAIGLVLVLACSANSTTYYVDETQALEQVIANLVSGDHVLFKRGDRWAGQVEVPCSNLTFGSYGVGPKPIIDGENNINWIFKIVDVSDITIDGLELMNVDSPTQSGNLIYVGAFKFTRSSNNIHLKNLTLHGAKTRGIALMGYSETDYADGIVIENCEIYDIGDWGDTAAADICIMHHVRAVTIRNCLLYGNALDRGVDGITFDMTQASGHLIENNHIWGHEENELDFKWVFEAGNEGRTQVVNNHLSNTKNTTIVIHRGSNGIDFVGNRLSGANLGVAIINHDSPAYEYCDGQEGDILFECNIVTNMLRSPFFDTGLTAGGNRLYNNIFANNGTQYNPTSWYVNINSPNWTVRGNAFYKNGQGRVDAGKMAYQVWCRVDEGLVMSNNLYWHPNEQTGQGVIRHSGVRTLAWMQDNTPFCAGSVEANPAFVGCVLGE